MNIAVWLFVYTPFPWLAIFYITAYRHDLFRLARPFKDYDSLVKWWSVCKYLGLIGDGAPRPRRMICRSKPLLALVVAATISLLWLVISIPLAWYYLVLLQVTSGLVLFLALVNRIGRLPTKPYKDTLRYPRLGTRIRHLSKAKGERVSTDSQVDQNPGVADA